MALVLSTVRPGPLGQARHGAALMRHLAVIARDASLRELIAEVLPENAPMLKVFEKSGLPVSTTRESTVVHVSLRLS